MSIYIELAKKTINEFVKNRHIFNVPNDLPKEMLEKRAGVFVSIHKHEVPLKGTRIDTKEGELRGCIGTILPTKNCIGEEIIDNAIAACSQDYRFEPIRPDELDNLEISVDVLSEPELIATSDLPAGPLRRIEVSEVGMRPAINQLNTKKYGVIVKSQDNRTGLLLPDLDGVNTPEQQIAICRQKAGILSNEPIDIYRFEVTRYKE